jgi:adenylylsulfate kinase-like enzyme
MDKKLTITISGPVCSGKTTFALALMELCEKHGIGYNADDGDLNRASVFNFLEGQDRRMAGLGKSVTVEIHTVQTRS